MAEAWQGSRPRLGLLSTCCKWSSVEPRSDSTEAPAQSFRRLQLGPRGLHLTLHSSDVYFPRILVSVNLDLCKLICTGMETAVMTRSASLSSITGVLAVRLQTRWLFSYSSAASSCEYPASARVHPDRHGTTGWVDALHKLTSARTETPHSVRITVLPLRGTTQSRQRCEWSLGPRNDELIT